MAGLAEAAEPTVYVIYIAERIERIFAALTEPHFTERYFFGRRVESVWRPGEPIVYRMPNGAVDISGRIIEIDPPRLVRFTWRAEWMRVVPELAETIVTYELEPLGEVCRVTMTEAHYGESDERRLEAGRRGWPIVFSGLKSLMETGRVPEIDMRLAMPPED